MKSFLLPILCIVLLPTYIDAAKYVLTAPSLARVGRSYKALLAVGYSNPSDAAVKLASSTRQIEYEGTKSLSGDGAVNEISINITEMMGLTTNDYMLQVENAEFNASVAIEIRRTPYSILIQTDKPIYKPSQTLRVRVAIIDDSLRPLNETVDVTIQDSKGTTLQVWRNQQTSMGLAQFELPLSERPPLGEWVITVATQTVTETKTVEVSEYVLPRFEVSVSANSYILTTAAEGVTVEVSAQYTFGEKVEGTLLVRLSNDATGLTTLKDNIPINGKATVTFNTNDVLSLDLSHGQTINVYVEVYEPLSEKTLNDSTSFSVSKVDYDITFEEFNSKNYRPGQQYTAYFKVTKPDGRCVADNMEKRLNVAVWAGYPSARQDEVTITVPSDCVVQVKLSMPNKDVSSHSIKLIPTLSVNGMEIIGDDVTDFSTFRSQNTDIYLQINADLSDTPQVENTLPIQIMSSATSGVFYYVVTARNQAVEYGTGNFNSPTAQVVVTRDYTPKATVVVYAIIEGELLADSISFSADGAFENNVEVEFLDRQGVIVTEAEPGDNVTVRVSTEPGSVLATLSLDKSIQILAGIGNNINQQRILTALMSHSTDGKSCDSSGDDDEGPIFWFFPRFGGSNSESIVNKAGLQIDTDAALSPCFDYVLRFMEAAPQGAVADGGIMFKGPTGEATDDGSSNSSPAKTRTNFVETWLWSISSSDGTSLLTETVPDTLTTWVTTVLSMHPTKGLAVNENPAELTVKKPFFITPTLPYSAVKGETLAIKITMYNYDVDADCAITVHGSDDFDVGVDTDSLASVDLTLSAFIQAGDGYAMTFWVSPNIVGMMNLSASGICSSGRSDAFIKELPIKAPGYPKRSCTPEFVQLLPGDDPVTVTINATAPHDIVPDSKTVRVSVTGDVMGPSIDGLERLVQMPYGCGEQNMITFTPNIFVRRYLEAINKLDADIKDKTTKYMTSGYQRELTYRHDDGSYSAFGNSDPSGSTWLTAFVIKCFRQASEFIQIDASSVRESTEWLLYQRKGQGEFDEPGKVIHSEMQGGSSGYLTLSAYAIIAVLEDLMGPEYDDNLASVATAVTVLEGSLTEVGNDTYKLAIITYALQLAGSAMVPRFQQMLESLQQDEAGMVWWERSDESTSSDNNRMGYYRRPPGPSSVEMASYALLFYVDKGDINKAKPISKWLIKNREGTGGFRSTQDTILGLQSLAAYARLVVSDSTNLNIQISTNSGNSMSHEITLDNSILTKRELFKPADSIKEVTAVVSGEGSTIIESCTGYNVKEKDDVKTVTVTTTLYNGTTDNAKTTLDACAEYIQADKESGMIMIMVNLPTGHTTDEDDIEMYEGNMARIEMENSGESVAVYVHEIETGEKACVRVSMTQNLEVKDIQDSYVEGYQYYNPSAGSISTYNALRASESVAPTLPPTNDRTTGGEGGSGADRLNPQYMALLMLIAAAQVALFQ